MDARGNVNAETLGNGVRRTHRYDGFALMVLFHGVVGGNTSVLGGGRFGHGFASGAVTALGTSLNNSRHIRRLGFSPLRVAIGAAVGGTASQLTGGKFVNGGTHRGVQPGAESGTGRDAIRKGKATSRAGRRQS